MKKLHVFAIAIGLSNAAIGFAEEIHEEKIYIQPQDVLFKDHSIFVYLGMQWVQTNALHTDANGIYVSSKDEKWPMPFQCYRCKRWNKGANFVCEYCGALRQD